MKYTTHELSQGTPEWLAYRANCYNASDAGTALGVNPYKTRQELIRELATGVTNEIDAGTQRRFDDGHRFEKLAIPLAEAIIGEPLSPTTVSCEVPGLMRRLSASLDGATFGDTENVEHKTLSASLAAAMDRGELPEQYPPQMEQGMMVTGATRCLFIASKWDSNDQLIDEKHIWYESNPELRAKIIAAWKQVEADVEAYQHTEAAPTIVVAPIDDLPALTVELVGQVTSSNLAAFKAAALERIESINTNLTTDEDFAVAKKTVKFLEDGEKRLVLVKQQALSQTASIDELFRTMDQLREEMKAKRLTLDKLVVAREASIKIEIMQAGKEQLAAHIAGLNKRLAKVQMPPIAADFAAAIKGKRNLESMRDAVSSLVAAKKIEANEIADRITINLQMLTDQARQPNADYSFLFSDYASLILKAPDDLALVIKSRIQEHVAAEEKRLAAERERIRVEEEAKAEAKVKAEQDAAEAQRKAAEEAAAKIERDRIVSAIPTPAIDAAIGAIFHGTSTTPTPEPAAQPAPATVGRLDETAVHAAPDNGRYIRLGEINAALGFTVTAEFLAGLGFVATQDKNARLYRECDVPALCRAIIAHVASVPERMQAGKLKAA